MGSTSMYRNQRSQGLLPDMYAVMDWTGSPINQLPESDISGRPFTNSVRDFSNTYTPYPTSVHGLQQDEWLGGNGYRNSVDARFQLIYQIVDGNLVLYKISPTSALWASNTFSSIGR